MTQENARLAFLQSLSYQDYLQTPEWQATSQAALKRVGKRCQLCLTRGEVLQVHHRSIEHLGCEQEEDLLVLCGPCTDLVSARLQAQAEERSSTQEGGEAPALTFSQKAGVGVVSALVTMGLPALLHAPLPAELFGFGAAIALAVKSPKIYAEIRDSLPAPLVRVVEGMAERKQARAQSGEWNDWDRLLGRHLQSTPVPQVDGALPPAPEKQQTEPQERALLEPVFPVYPERVTLRLGKAIDRAALMGLTQAFERDKESYRRMQVPGRRFDPHFNGLLGKGWVAAANQGFGKSILNGVVIEQAGAHDLPCIVLDHKGEYGTVKELPFMHALLVGGEGPVDFLLTPKNVDDFVDLVFRERYQAIVHLPSYGSGWLGKAEISAAVGQALMRYAEKQRQLQQKLLPCLVIMDEAQLYLPQDQTLLPPEAMENKGVLSELKNAYFALVSNGRSAGYTVGFATQSLTYLAKWAIKSSQIRIFGRHAEKNDLDACEQIINPAVATRAQIESFPPGVAVVFGLTTQPMIVQFDHKQSRDLSETPSIEWLHEHPPQTRSSLTQTAGQTHATLFAEPRKERGERRGGTMDIETLLLLKDQVDEQTFRRLIELLPDRGPTGENGEEKFDESRATQVQPGRSRQVRSGTRSEGEQEANALYRAGMTPHMLARQAQISLVEAHRIVQQRQRAAQGVRPSGRAPAPAEVPSLVRGSKGEEQKPRGGIEPAELAKAFALWQGGACSVRRLEEAAREAGYGWSNGKVRAIIEAMREAGLIPKKSDSVL